MVRMPNVNGRISRLGGLNRARMISTCKAADCGETIYSTDDRVWSMNPIGLVHGDCATRLDLSVSGPVTEGERVGSQRASKNR